RESQRLPLFVATLAADKPSTPHTLPSIANTAIDRIFKWTPNHTRRRQAMQSAMARHFNRDVLMLIHGEQYAHEIFDWLTSMPFISRRQDNWVFHNIVRTILIRQLRSESIIEWERIHTELAKFYADEITRRHEDPYALAAPSAIEMSVDHFEYEHLYHM